MEPAVPRAACLVQLKLPGLPVAKLEPHRKVVPVYDAKTGEPKTRHKIERDNKGNIIREYDEVIMDNENPRIDGWFLCIAPLEKPQLAMAVIVEGGGYGSRSAAPIAAQLVLKARDLGYFGRYHGNRLTLIHSNEENRASSHLLIILLILDSRSQATSPSIAQVCCVATKPPSSEQSATC